MISREAGDRREEETILKKLSDLQAAKKTNEHRTQETKVSKGPEEKGKSRFHKFGKSVQSLFKNKKNG